MSHPCPPGELPTLLSLPDLCLASILANLDGRSLVQMEAVASCFSRPLLEGFARAECLSRCANSRSEAERFRHRSWRERLHIEEVSGVGFDRAWSEEAGFAFQFRLPAADGTAPAALHAVRLQGMGPKLLLSDRSTADQPVIRWRLRVKGNTAVEFGVIPAALQPSHTSLHKCAAAPRCPDHRAMGFCSQITAGSLLPLKAPVMRGTLLDVMACRGRLEVVLTYPPDAKEISWQNGQPVQRPYRGPQQLRFEQDFAADYDVRLAVTSWAKAHFEVLHTTPYELDPEWAAAAMSAEAALAAAGTHSVQPEGLAAAGFAGPDYQEAQLLGGMLEAFPLAQPPPGQEAGVGAAAGAGLHLAAAVAELEEDALEDEELPPAEEEAMLAALMAELPVAAGAPQPPLPAALGGGTAATMLAPGPGPTSSTPAPSAGVAASLAAAAMLAGPHATVAGAGAPSGLCPSLSADLSLDGHVH